MTEVERLARFVDQRQFADISAKARQQLKIRVLDTVGVAVGALNAPPILAVSRLIDELGGKPLSTLIGRGKTAPDRAAFFNGALSRYLDFMDSYLAPHETNHPSDNMGAVLAAASARSAASLVDINVNLGGLDPDLSRRAAQAAATATQVTSRLGCGG